MVQETQSSLSHVKRWMPRVSRRLTPSFSLGRDFCFRFSSWQHQKRVVQPSFVSRLSCTLTYLSENALHWDVGACYRNRYPDMRHMLVASIRVISFASARGSTAAKVRARNTTRPEGTSNASRSCWRSSSIDSNSMSGTLVVSFCLAVCQTLDISLTFIVSRPFFATLAGRSPGTMLSIS